MSGRFFVNYQKGHCTRQFIGKNKIAQIPQEIAAFLKLPCPESYTGHCFRRTSATLLADSGATITTLKRHGGWKSDTVAEGYIAESVENKVKTGNVIASAVLGVSNCQNVPRPSCTITSENHTPIETNIPGQSDDSQQKQFQFFNCSNFNVTINN